MVRWLVSAVIGSLVGLLAVRLDGWLFGWSVN